MTDSVVMRAIKPMITGTLAWEARSEDSSHLIPTMPKTPSTKPSRRVVTASEQWLSRWLFC